MEEQGKNKAFSLYTKQTSGILHATPEPRDLAASTFFYSIGQVGALYPYLPYFAAHGVVRAVTRERVWLILMSVVCGPFIQLSQGNLSMVPQRPDLLMRGHILYSDLESLAPLV